MAERLLNAGNSEPKLVRGYDKITETRLRSTVEVKLTKGHELIGDFSGFSYTVSIEDTALTLGADVLVGSLWHYLESKQVDAPNVDLGSQDAVEGFPLADTVYGVTDSGPYISDALYKHPGNSNR